MSLGNLRCSKESTPFWSGIGMAACRPRFLHLHFTYRKFWFSEPLKMAENWSGKEDSNLRPLPPEDSALPG